MSVVTTSDPSYVYPLRPRVTFISQDNKTTLLNFDAFQTTTETWLTSPGGSPYVYPTPNTPGFNVLQVNVSVGMNTAGIFEIFIEDRNRVIDRTKVGLGNRVNIAASKTPWGYKDIIHGLVKKIETKRDDTGVLYYVVSGYGTQIICNERIVDFHKLAARTQMGSTTASKTDASMVAYNLFKTVFEGTAHLPFKGPTIISQGPFTESGIDTRVNDFIPAISEPMVTASSVLDKIAEYAGATWGIQNDNIFFRYPTAMHSGITIQDHVSATDDATKVAYFTGPMDYIDSMDQTDGFVNRIVLKGGALTPAADIQSTSGIGWTSLFNKDIATQIIPTTSSLKNLALLLSVVGTGGSTNVQYVSGAIVQDNAGLPTGAKVLDLQVPLSSIGTVATAVFDFNQKLHIKHFIAGDAYWIILYAKGTDENNTVRWWNDGDLTTPNRFSAARQAVLDPSTEDRTQTPLKTDSSGWSVSTTGPVFSHAYFAGVKALSEASDPLSINKYGLVEAVHNIPFITDNQTLQVYATTILASLAKPIRKFQMQYVTIPNNFVYLPGQQIDIVDSFSGIAPPHSLSAEIQDIKYTFLAGSASSGSMRSSAPQGGGLRPAHPMGATYVDLTAIAYIDFLTDSLT